MGGLKHKSGCKMINKALEDNVKRHEGLRLKAYKCSEGKLTIGYGHNLDANGIPQIVADDLLHIDLMAAQRELFATFPTYRDLSLNRQNALVDMSFHLGMPSLKRFKKMHSALSRGDFDEAAIEVLDSKYATQTGSRALENSELILNG